MAVLRDTVLYGISSADQETVSLRGLIKGEGLGRYPKAGGDVQPAIVVNVNGDATLDLHILLDAVAPHTGGRNVAQGTAETAGAWWPKV